MSGAVVFLCVACGERFGIDKEEQPSQGILKGECENCATPITNARAYMTAYRDTFERKRREMRSDSAHSFIERTVEVPSDAGQTLERVGDIVKRFVFFESKHEPRFSVAEVRINRSRLAFIVHLHHPNGNMRLKHGEMQEHEIEERIATIQASLQELVAEVLR